MDLNTISHPSLPLEGQQSINATEASSEPTTKVIDDKHKMGLAKKVALAAGAVLFSPILIPLGLVGGGVYLLGKKIHREFSLQFRPNSTIAEVVRMKEGEERAKLKAMQAVWTDFKGKHPNFSKDIDGLLGKKLDNANRREIFKSKIRRELVRELARQGIEYKKDADNGFIDAMVNKLASLEGTDFEESIKKVATTLKSSPSSKESFQQDFRGEIESILLESLRDQGIKYEGSITSPFFQNIVKSLAIIPEGASIEDHVVASLKAMNVVKVKDFQEVYKNKLQLLLEQVLLKQGIVVKHEDATENAFFQSIVDSLLSLPENADLKNAVAKRLHTIGEIKLVNQEHQRLTTALKDEANSLGDAIQQAKEESKEVYNNLQILNGLKNNAGALGKAIQQVREKKVYDKAEIGNILEKKAHSLSVTLQQTRAEVFNLKSYPHVVGLELKQKLKDLILNVEGPSKNISKVNQEFVEILRSILESEGYKLLKEDIDNPAITLIHQFASGIWNNVQALDQYANIGKRITQGKKIVDDTDHTLSGVGLSKQIEGAHKNLARKLFTDHGIIHKVSYAFTHVAHAKASLASESGDTGLINKLRRTVFGTYDSHGQLANNPSIQGVTTTTLNKKAINVNNVYGGSPTIGDASGDRLAPEFLAVLQAAENNQFAEAEKQIKGIPHIITYTNFQNIDSKGGEGSRSRVIMEAKKNYPLSFLPMTLPKDTAFYKMEDHEAVTWEGAQKFGNELKKELMHPSSFKISGRADAIGHTSGFYFVGTPEEWEPVFNAAIKQANIHFDDKRKLEGQDAFELKAAYQEFVYSLFQVYQELKAAQSLEERNLDRPLVMAIRACKENVDRGGAENAKYMYTRLEESQPERLNLILGVLNSRALAARDRIILKKRILHLLAFIKHVTPKNYQKIQHEFLKEVFKQDVRPTYQPVLDPAHDFEKL